MEVELAVVWYAESLCDKFCMVINKNGIKTCMIVYLRLRLTVYSPPFAFFTASSMERL